MAEVSVPGGPESFRRNGTGPEAARNPVRERLSKSKRESIESAMKKRESWCQKLLAGDSGVLIDDLPALLHALGLKVVDVNKFCVDRELAISYERIACAAMKTRSLFDEDAE